VHELSRTQPLASDLERIAQLECDHARLAEDHARLAEKLQEAQSSYARLHRAYTHALEQLQLLRHRLFVAKAERVPAHADQLAFDALFAQVQTLQKALEQDEGDQDDARTKDDQGDPKKKKNKPKGRRDLSKTNLPERRVEILDPNLEGKAKRIGFEESFRLGYERGGMRRVVVARAVYDTTEPMEPVKISTSESEITMEANSEAAPKIHNTESTEQTATATSDSNRPVDGTSEVKTTIVTAPLPKELFRRALLLPSMIAHLLTAKYMMGIPFYRLEQKFALEGFSLDRGTMCRYAEDAGATLGAIVEAMRKDAFDHAFCLSTDATGVSIQLGPLAERGGQRKPCRKGHCYGRRGQNKSLPCTRNRHFDLGRPLPISAPGSRSHAPLSHLPRWSYTRRRGALGPPKFVSRSQPCRF
jgi:transposase